MRKLVHHTTDSTRQLNVFSVASNWKVSDCIRPSAAAIARQHTKRTAAIVRRLYVSFVHSPISVLLLVTVVYVFSTSCANSDPVADAAS